MMKNIFPPLILRRLTSIFFGFSGNYSNWDEASVKSTGYDSEVIFDKVKHSLLKVKNGEAKYERDSVLFDKIHYSLPLLSSLGISALNNNNTLNVLDFGGSLGSSFYQNRKQFEHLCNLNWCIVEQGHFVKEGKDQFEENNLHFFYDVDSCLEKYKINFLLLSSVLQYIEKPYLTIENLLSKNIEFILIDRTPVMLTNSDRLTIQKVPSYIYNAKYPAWLLSENNLINYFSSKYDLIFEEELLDSINLDNAKYKSYFFRLKKQNFD